MLVHFELESEKLGSEYQILCIVGFNAIRSLIELNSQVIDEIQGPWEEDMARLPWCSLCNETRHASLHQGLGLRLSQLTEVWLLTTQSKSCAMIST